MPEIVEKVVDECKLYIEKVVSVYQQKVLCVTVPKKIANALGIKKGSLIKYYKQEDEDFARIYNVSKKDDEEE